MLFLLVDDKLTSMYLRFWLLFLKNAEFLPANSSATRKYEKHTNPLQTIQLETHTKGCLGGGAVDGADCLYRLFSIQQDLAQMLL